MSAFDFQQEQTSDFVFYTSDVFAANLPPKSSQIKPLTLNIYIKIITYMQHYSVFMGHMSYKRVFNLVSSGLISFFNVNFCTVITIISVVFVRRLHSGSHRGSAGI